MRKINMIRLFVALLISYAIGWVFTYQMGDVKESDYQIVDEYLTTEVFRNNGTYEKYDTNKFPVTNLGDTIIGRLTLPKDLEIPNAGISFRITNCTIRIVYDGDTLYSYGEELYRKKQTIGAIYVKCQIPQEAWGKELQIICVATERDSLSSIGKVAVMKAQDLVRFPLIHRELGFMMYVSMFIISCMMLLYFLINGKYDSMGRQGIYLSGFSICASLWIISYTGMYTVFSNNMIVFANIEYISFFLIPIPFLLYLIEQQRGQRSEKILRRFVVIFAIFFVVATILNYTVPTMHYTRMIKYFHLVMMVASIIVIYICITSKNTVKRDKYIILSGLSFSLVLFLMDVVFYNINKFTSLYIDGRKYTCSEIGIAVFLVTMLLGYGIRLIDFFIRRKEKERLEELAYIDGMTQLFNRAGCFVMMKALDKKEHHTYQAIYLDVNCLKKTNDMLGHEAGDRLISQVAAIIRDSFGAVGFCGRLGGDEFLVIIQNKSKRQVQKLLDHFENEIIRFNESRGYLLPISVSYGTERHERDDTRTAEEIIRVADGRMYFEKKLGKQ